MQCVAVRAIALCSTKYTLYYTLVKYIRTYAKVSKVQKQIFLFAFEPKKELNYFLNSALASKMSQIKKIEGIGFLPILDP